MADGSVKIDVGLNISKAEKDLAKLREKIAKTEAQLNADTSRKSALFEQLKEADAKADEAKRKVIELKKLLSETRSRDEKSSIRQQLAEATEEERILTKESNRLNSEYEKVGQSIEKGTTNLTEMQQEAGELSQQIARAKPGDVIAQSLESARKSLMKFLKYAFGIRSVYFLFRRLRSAITESVKAYAEYDQELKSQLATMDAMKKTLQVGFGSAFAQIYQAILPVIQKLMNWMIEAANAASRFIAILSGKGSYKKAIVDTSEVAASLEDTSAAADDVAESAKEAKKQLMGFDELNVLSDDSGSSSGKGSATKPGKTALDGVKVVDEAIDALDGSFLDKLALSVKDVLFDWDDLNPEQIAEKIMAGLGAVLGAALGISLGLGPGGVIMMTLAGLTMGLIFDALIFDHDGRLSGTELTDMILVILNSLVGGVAGFLFTRTFKGAMIGASIAAGLTLAYKAIDMKADGALSKNGIAGGLTSLLAGVLGLQVGKTIFAGSAIAGPAGAAIGIVVGLVLTLVVESIKAKMAARDAFYDTELGKQVEDLKKQIEESLQTSVDLKVHINSITGEVDESTIANLGAAQVLIDQIFTLDEKENKTSEEIALINAYIQELNGLGLPGVFAQFDEATQHVTGTRDALMQTTDELLKQYQVQAMGEAYVEALKAQYSAQEDRTRAIQNGQQAVEDYHAAEQALADAEAEYAAARENYNMNAGYGESQARLDEAKAALEAAKEGVAAARANAEEADQAIQAALDNIGLAADKVGTMEQSFTELVTNVSQAGTDTAQGFIENYNATAEGMPAAAEESAQATQDALRDIWQTHSPSKVSEEIAGDVTEGFVQGFNNHTPDVVSAAHSMFDAIYNEISSSVERIKSIMDFQWSLPRPRIPVITASYSNFSYGNGQSVSIPQFFVNWYARGGIFDFPQLIGVGENGKEAVVPLERNTEWMNLVADGIMERLEKARFANQLADAFMSAARPAMASGQIIPPNALTAAPGGGFSHLSSGGVGEGGEDGFITRLSGAIYDAVRSAVGSAPSRGGNHVAILEVNGREFCRATFNDQQAVAKEKGVSLITNG